jgi:hypothetical protein
MWTSYQLASSCSRGPAVLVDLLKVCRPLWLARILVKSRRCQSRLLQPPRRTTSPARCLPLKYLLLFSIRSVYSFVVLSSPKTTGRGKATTFSTAELSTSSWLRHIRSYWTVCPSIYRCSPVLRQSLSAVEPMACALTSLCLAQRGCVPLSVPPSLPIPQSSPLLGGGSRPVDKVVGLRCNGVVVKVERCSGP